MLPFVTFIGVIKEEFFETPIDGVCFLALL